MGYSPPVIIFSVQKHCFDFCYSNLSFRPMNVSNDISITVVDNTKLQYQFDNGHV